MGAVALGLFAGTVPGHEDTFVDSTVILTGNRMGWKCTRATVQIENNTFFTPSGGLYVCGLPLRLAQWYGEHADSTKNNSVSFIPEQETILNWARELLSVQGEVKKEKKEQEMEMKHQ